MKRFCGLEWSVVNTKGDCQKSWLAIGRCYDSWGDFDYVYIDFINWQLQVGK